MSGPMPEGIGPWGGGCTCRSGGVPAATRTAQRRRWREVSRALAAHLCDGRATGAADSASRFAVASTGSMHAGKRTACP